MNTILQFSPPVIAHRGASAYAPENTIAAFSKAVDLGIKWVEFDVMFAACGEPIVFHDESLERTTQSAGEVNQYPYSYLQSLDAGSWFNPCFAGERIPSLAQTVAWLKTNKMNANVEIKGLPGDEEKLVQRSLQELAPLLEQRQSPCILFSSFSVEALFFLRKYAPDCAIGLLMHEWLPDWQHIVQSLNCVSVHVNEEIMTKERAAEIKSMNKYLLCYTVNDVKRAKLLYSWGVDAVFSDMPDQILKGEGHV